MGTLAGQTARIIFKELAANGVNYVSLQSRDSIIADIEFVLPSADGAANQALITDASGVLSWGGHDDLNGFVAEEHIDWTNATDNLKTTGSADVGDVTINSPVNVYNLDHDSFAGFVAEEHIDWTDATDDLKTTGMSCVGHVKMLERSSDPSEPSEGECVIWMSDGTGKGDDGDIIIASKAGGVTNWTTLFDHSLGAAW